MLRVQLLGLQHVPGACVRARRPGLVHRHLEGGILHLVHDPAAAVDADLAGSGLDADEDVLLAGDAPVGGLDPLLDGADQRLLGDLLLGIELEERTDEVATHHAPPCCLTMLRHASDTKKRGLVTHVPRRPLAIARKYTPGPVDRQIPDPGGAAYAGPVPAP